MLQPFRLFLAALIALTCVLVAPAWAQQSTAEQRNVEVSLHSSRASIRPGERFTIVMRQQIREHWHTYWRNPGDSGEATRITWRLPRGFSAGDIQWPVPTPIPFEIVINYGFSGEVLFPIEITAPANLRPGSVAALAADSTWLVCSEICIMEDGALTLAVPVTAQGADDPVWAPRIAQAVANLPRVSNTQARIGTGNPASLSIALDRASEVRNPYFFPYPRDAIDHSKPQSARAGASGVSFRLVEGSAHNLGQGPLQGVLTYELGGAKQAIEITAQPGQMLAATGDRPARFSADFPVSPADDGVQQAAQPTDAAGMLAAIALAFLGGLILNIMPCVLPVLSIKALSLAGGVQSGRARREGVLYGAGVLATFIALALLLIVLRGAGEAVGWGFQLQLPWVSAALALLFFAIGLNLLGVFEITAGQNAGGALTAKGGDAGAFFTGALAVIAATPCTAPFMATAIGAVLTQSAGATLLIFTALALGFAAPLVALSFAPGLQKLIPKPGPWMERFKHVLAFPMFGAAVWLAWVVTEQTGAAGALSLLSLTVALAFVLVAMRWGRVWLIASLAALALTGAFTWRPLVGAPVVETLASEPWSAARVTALRAEGRGVFVNFTAAWCVSCKVNEITSLSRPAVARAFAERNVAYLKGDWTNRDPDIAAALAAHGRAGVPLYLYYPADGREPLVLPQLLTESMVLNTIAGETP